MPTSLCRLPLETLNRLLCTLCQFDELIASYSIVRASCALRTPSLVEQGFAEDLVRVKETLKVELGYAA